VFLILKFRYNFLYFVVCYMIKESPVWVTGAHNASLRKYVYVACASSGLEVCLAKQTLVVEHNTLSQRAFQRLCQQR
jgi:hypothetical protein